MFTLKARPGSSWTDKQRNYESNAARFNVAKFGQVRFGNSDGWTRKVRNMTLLRTAALADFAYADEARADVTLSQNWLAKSRPAL